MTLRHVRVVRVLRAGLTIVAAVLRYLWLRVARRPQAAWDRAHARTGRAIHRLATRYGGAFIKVGQVLGSRGDLLPAPLVEPLRALHDRVPPRPFDRLRRHVEHELRRPLADVFAHVDEQALAAASLAQVHRARLLTGEEVVLKIQYPEARRLFPVDLRSMRRGVRVARWLAKVDLRPVADELAELIMLELAFDREAESTERVRAAFAADPRVRVPRVYKDLSTDRLLVLEYLEGIPLSQPDALRAAGLDLRRVAESVAAIYATMIFEHGFFHADPHPGNLRVLPDGETIALLDFGLAKQLPPGFADAIAAMIVKAMSGDIPAALVAARSVGFDATGDPEAFRDLIRMLMGDSGIARGALATLQASTLERIPSHFALIARTFVILNGLSHQLVPNERVIAGALARALAPRLLAAQAAASTAARPP